MSGERVPLPRWVNPRHEVLLGNVFASGRPPFLPFPTILNVSNAAHCSQSIFHDLLHGIDYALTQPFYERDYYDLFVRFIAILKNEIINGSFEIIDISPSQIQAIQDRFFEFTTETRFEVDAAFDLWRLFLEPWVERKLISGELLSLNEHTELYFYVDVANPSTPFKLNSNTNRTRSYPIRGNLTEIDLTNERLIERTNKGNRDDETPPLMTDYQIWLKQRIISNLSNSQLPESWRDISFDDFEIIVETPYRDFMITERDNFYADTHRAFSWISDICTSDTSRILGEVYENQNCTSENANIHCEFPYNVCFKNRFPFPLCRPEIRRAFQPWYRSLLWERMWSGDLWHYQLLMLSRDELIDLHFIEETRVLNYNNNQLELEVVSSDVNTFRGQERCTIIPFGTTFCGIRIDGILTNVEENRLVFQMENRIPPISEEALLLLSPESTSTLLKSEPPTFIQRTIQRDLFNLKHIGAQTPRNSLRRSVIQLLEAIFGRRRLRRGRR